MENIEQVKAIIQSSIQVKQSVLKDSKMISNIIEVVDQIVSSFKNDGKILLCGNGGSAADAQHIAAEFSGRFYHDREPLFAEALHVNTSYLTAVANDYGYTKVYARIVKAKGNEGDILIAISTSGNSENIINAAKQASEQGLKVVGLTGQSGGALKDYSDWLLNVPSTDTPRIQESHIMIGHIICELVEAQLM